MVDAQTVCTATVFGRISSAGGDAVAENTSNRGAISSNRVTAVALIGVLQTSVVVSTALTVTQTGFDSHGAGGESAAIQSPSTTVRATSDVIPSSDVRRVAVGSRDGRDRASGVAVRSLVWSPSDGVAARKCVKRALDLLVDLRGDNA